VGYVDCNGFHSINMQAVYDANLIFQDIVAKWPAPLPPPLLPPMISLTCSIMYVGLLLIIQMTIMVFLCVNIF